MVTAVCVGTAGTLALPPRPCSPMTWVVGSPSPPESWEAPGQSSELQSEGTALGRGTSSPET